MINSKAPELRVAHWIDDKGDKCDSLNLNDLGNGFKILYCFQHWCAGCHSHGFPMLKYLFNKLIHKDVGFAAVQTVFEGEATNTYEKLIENQNKYELRIPFGHDIATLDEQYPSLMNDYQTRGTPWFIFVNPAGIITYSDFRLDINKAVEIFGEGKLDD